MGSVLIGLFVGWIAGNLLSEITDGIRRKRLQKYRSDSLIIRIGPDSAKGFIDAIERVAKDLESKK